MPTGTRFHVVGQTSYLFLGTTLFGGAVRVEGGNATVNFNSVVTGSTSGSTQSFAIKSIGGNATISSVTGNTVTLTTSPKSGSTQTIHYYYIGSTPPASVVYGSQNIPLSQYQTTTGGFSICVAPCVLLNQANNTLIVKSTSSLSTILFSTIAFSARCLSFVSILNGISSGASISTMVIVVLALVLVVSTLMSIRGKMNLGSGSVPDVVSYGRGTYGTVSASNIPYSVILILFVAALIVVGTYLDLTLGANGQILMGC